MLEWNQSVKKISSPRKHEQKLKTWLGNLTENADKKSMTTSKMIKQRKNTGTCWEKKKRKATQQLKDMTRGNKPESSGERRKTKKILR